MSTPLGVGVTRDRMAQVSPAGRSLHRTILRSFATTGQPPEVDDPLLRELHDRDVIRLDGQGRIRVAYPFSAIPTRHSVSIQDGPTVYAMCAVDALGVAEMLGCDVAIASTDPWSGEPIQIGIRDRHIDWRPAETVVFVGSEGDCCAPATDRCCTLMNFFASKENAVAWRDSRPSATGEVLTRQEALQLGADIFGHLLDD